MRGREGGEREGEKEVRGREGGREEGEGREEGSRESGTIIVSGGDLVADKLCLLGL